MMEKLLKELAPLVVAENERISKKDGEKYTSAHDAYQELDKNFSSLSSDFNMLNTQEYWTQQSVLSKNTLKFKYLASDIKKYALDAAAEAIQVAAVCEKISRGFEK